MKPNNFLTEEKIAEIRAGHFPEGAVLPAVKQISGFLDFVQEGVSREVGTVINWKTKGFAKLDDRTNKLTYQEKGDNTFEVALNSKVVGTISTEVQEAFEWVSDLVEKAIEEMKESIKSKKESIPHEEDWNFIEEKNPIAFEGDKENGMSGYFKLDMGNKKLEGLTDECWLLESAAQHIAPLVTGEKEVPTFTSIRTQRLIDYDNVPQDVEVKFRLKKVRKIYKIEVVFLETATGEAFMASEFEARVMREDSFKNLIRIK